MKKCAQPLVCAWSRNCLIQWSGTRMYIWEWGGPISRKAPPLSASGALVAIFWVNYGAGTYIDLTGQPAGECKRLFTGQRAKALQVSRMGLPFKRGEPLAERIDAGVLLLERIDLVLLRGNLGGLFLQLI